MEQSAAGRRWVVIDSFPESAVRYRGVYSIVCVDVFTASTTLASSLAQGRRSFAATSREEAERFSRALATERPILAGEIDGNGLLGGEMLDSPAQIERRGEIERPLVHYSSPTGELLAACGHQAPEIYVTGLRNLGATARLLAARARNVAILGAGYHSEFSCEDQFACAQLAYRLIEHGFELGDLRSMEIVRRWRDADPSLLSWGNSAAALRRQRRGEDIDFVLAHFDDLPWACRYEANGEITRVAVTEATSIEDEPRASSEGGEGRDRIRSVGEPAS